MIVSTLIRMVLEEVQQATVANFLNLLNRKTTALAQLRLWNHYRAEHQFSIVNEYTTGTVSVASGATTVTGVGTAFASTHDGWKIRFAGSNHYYVVDSITSGTELELTEDFFETTLSGASFTLYQDEYTLPTDYMHFGTMTEMDMDYDFLAEDYKVEGTVVIIDESMIADRPILLKYWRKPTSVTIPSDTIDIPDLLETPLFCEMALWYLNSVPAASELEMMHKTSRISALRAEYASALNQAKSIDTTGDNRTPLLKRVFL